MLETVFKKETSKTLQQKTENDKLESQSHILISSEKNSKNEETNISVNTSNPKNKLN